MMTSLEESIQVVDKYADGETDKLLIKTAGKSIKGDVETIVYRPYYVIGLQLWLATDNNIKTGEGATFDQNFETSRRYFLMQSFIDSSDNLVIPPEYTCANMLSVLLPDIAAKSIGFIVI